MSFQTLNSPSIIPNPTVRFSVTTPTGKRSNKRKRPRDYVEEEYLAMCLVKLARGSTDVVKCPISHTVKYPTSLEEEEEEEKIVLTTIDVKKDQEPTSYTCNVCNKSFSSHQALGGHKGSHRTKARATIVEDGNVVKSTIEGKVHECSTCHKTFATGQALGGHMRKHFEGVMVSAKNRSSDAKTHSNDGGAATISTARVVSDFDLNVALTEDLYCDEAESEFM